MTEWQSHSDHTVRETYMLEGGHRGRLIVIEEHRGHQNWEADAWLLEVDSLTHIPMREGDIIDSIHGANKREVLEYARDEWDFDVPEEEWRLDPSWSNVHPDIGPGGVVGR